ncbi:serine protease snake-like [Diorhabda sublineata]|uniref:serine protease snake-like n=1 Tax=Diorhabda sublineata TaxID=1163346 RepID=UPI0024E16331|nr:serine protease snake-like [Diorhabda sublineata]
MLGNKFFDKIIFVILWCTTGNPVAVKKASIITTEGDTPNNQQWSLPFFDNNFGLISNGAAITPSPPRVSIVSTPPPTLSTIIETSSTSASTVNIDLSDTELNIGWRSSSVLPTFATAPPPRNKISQKKCAEYYSTGRRATRTSKVQVFIINGEISKQKEFPHMAALGYGAKNDNQWLCGGSLISENYVVTAAHCLSTKSLGPVQYVRLGTTTLQTETLQSEDYNVIQRIPYPSYVEGRQYDDIALLRLDRSVEFSDYIAPICLHSSTVPDGVKLTATGWGRTTPTGNTTEELRKVELDIISFYVCQKAYSVASKEELPYGIVENSQICAGSSDGSKDTCQGDSGGPLSLVREGRLYLVGITSFGIGCAKPGIPGVYTRVSHYVPWLEQTVWGQ